METILYQGRKIRVQVISEVNVVRGEGMDFILRDTKGRYYIRRETYNEMGYRWAKRNREASNYRCYVHRISVRTAIFFQISLAAGRTLRTDAARLLASGRAGGCATTKAGRLVVELDDLASTMLRQVCQEGNACYEAGEDPRDLVSAAVTFYLSDDDDYRRGEFNLECGDDALKRAKSDRLAAEGAA